MAKGEETTVNVGGGPTAAQVADYLRRNPDFLASRPDLAALLTPPERFDEDNVADLQRYRIAHLQKQLKAAKTNTETVVASSRINHSGQAQVHATVLALLSANGFTSFLNVVWEDMPALLGLDAASLCLESIGESFNPSSAPWGVRTLAAGAVEDYLQGKAVLLRGDIAGDETLYGQASGLVRSDALIRIEPGEGLPEGLLALGERHPATFQGGQGTELLTFLASVVEHCLRRWLKDLA